MNIFCYYNGLNNGFKAQIAYLNRPNSITAWNCEFAIIEVQAIITVWEHGTSMNQGKNKFLKAYPFLQNINK